MPSATDTGVVDVGFGWVPSNDATLEITDTQFAGVRFTDLPHRSFTFDPGYLGATSSTRTERTTLFNTISLELECVGVGPDTLIVDLVNQADPAAFTALTFDLNDGTYPLTLAVATVDFAAGPYFTTTAIDLADIITKLHATAGPNGWAGKFAFRLRGGDSDIITVTSALGVNKPTLATTETSGIETGIGGLRWVGSGVLRDYVTHQYVRRDEAVESGYFKGRMVDPENYDPPDDTLMRRAAQRRRLRDRRT